MGKRCQSGGQVLSVKGTYECCSNEEDGEGEDVREGRHC